MSMTAMNLVQDGLVTLVALGAGGLVFRRLLRFARPAKGGAPACANYPSGRGHCQPASAAAPAAPAERPLVFVRSPRP